MIDRTNEEIAISCIGFDRERSIGKVIEALLFKDSLLADKDKKIASLTQALIEAEKAFEYFRTMGLPSNEKLSRTEKIT